MGKEVVTDTHSLYIQDIQKYETNQIIPAKRYLLYIGSFRSDHKELFKILNSFDQATNEDILDIKICSAGGRFYEFLALINTIASKFSRKNITTEVTSFAYSAGASIFLIGSTRIMHRSGSSLMFHNYSTNLEGKAHEVKDELVHELVVIEKYIRDTLKPYFSKKELEKIIDGKDFWLSPREALKRGIATKLI